MNANGNRSYQPLLESLEDRFLLTGYRRVILLPGPHLPGAATTRGTGTPAAIHTIVNPASVASRTVSLVPQHISLGYDQPSPITIHGSDLGIVEPGLPGAFVSDPGLTTPGLPIYTPSQPLTPPPLQVGGLTLSPEGIISGSFP